MTDFRAAWKFSVASAVAMAVASLACFAVPIYVIRPFRHQGAAELDVALFVKQVGPWASIVCAVIAAGICAANWRGLGGWMQRTGMVLALLVAAGGAYLARVNVYEMMFRPLGPPQFMAARDSRIDGDDMVIAVREDGVSRAYPVREMAYHHVVNDVVGKEPIVSTY